MITVDPDAMVTGALGAPEAATFNPYREHVVIFPFVEPGDSIELVYRRERQRGLMPDAFFIQHIFERRSLERVEVTVTAPPGVALSHHESGLVATERESDGRRIYTWSSVAGDGLTRDANVVISTFSNQTELAARYRRLEDSRYAPSPDISALAQQIVAGIDFDRDRARAIFDWVRTNIRYVAVLLGSSNFLPNAPRTILDRRYGDCKDHALILRLLLAAIGIESETVLVAAGAHYTIDWPPTAITLNHVITYLPHFDLYVDSSIEFGRFDTLPIELYGKPTLHAGPSPRLGRAPALTADQNVSELATTLAIDAEGRMTGRTEQRGRGPFGMMLRMLAGRIEARGANAVAADQLRSLGWLGTGAFEQMTEEDSGGFYRIAGSFTLDRRTADGQRMSLPTGLRLLVGPGEYLLNSERRVGTGKAMCFAGRQIERITVALPERLTLSNVPRSRDVRTPVATYRAAFTLEPHQLTIERVFEVTVPGPVCSDADIAGGQTAITAALEDGRHVYQFAAR